MDIELLPDDCEYLEVFYVRRDRYSVLFHVLAPVESLSRYGDYYTLCKRKATGYDTTIFRKSAEVDGLICPECEENLEQTRDVLGRVWIPSIFLPLLEEDIVVVVDKDSEYNGQRGRVTHWSGYDTINEDQAWVNMPSFPVSPLKFEKSELVLVIDP
jgi:hypothetical protein